MKKALTMLLNFTALLILGLIIGAFIQIQFITSTNMVAGNPIQYPKSIIFYAILENAPIAVLIMIPATLIWKIRHLENPVATALTYVFLCLLSWLVILPAALSLKKFVPAEIEETIARKNELSAGYFRNYDDRYYYFLTEENAEEKTSQALMLYNSRNPHFFGDEETVKTDKNSDISTVNEPFKDPLYKEIMGDFPWKMFYVMNIFKQASKRAWNNGYISWLCFCSFGLLISTPYFFIKLSKWRMVNFTYTIFVQLGGLLFNTLYFTSAFTQIRKILSSLVYGDDFSRFTYFQAHEVQLPLAFLNLITGIIVAVTGIVINAVRKKKYS